MKNTPTVDAVRHPATVISTDTAKGTVRVSIDNEEECHACPAARLCAAGKGDRQPIEVFDPRPSRFQPGEKVSVVGTETIHRKAIMTATVIPCLILVGVMTAVYAATRSQGLAAGCGIGTMALFFLLLYLGRNKLAHEFTFTINKLK